LLQDRHNVGGRGAARESAIMKLAAAFSAMAGRVGRDVVGASPAGMQCLHQLPDGGNGAFRRSARREASTGSPTPGDLDYLRLRRQHEFQRIGQDDGVAAPWAARTRLQRV